MNSKQHVFKKWCRLPASEKIFPSPVIHNATRDNPVQTKPRFTTQVPRAGCTKVAPERRRVSTRSRNGYPCRQARTSNGLASPPPHPPSTEERGRYGKPTASATPGKTSTTAHHPSQRRTHHSVGENSGRSAPASRVIPLIRQEMRLRTGATPPRHTDTRNGSIQ